MLGILRVTKVGKNVQNHLVQPFTYRQYFLLNHVPYHLNF